MSTWSTPRAHAQTEHYFAFVIGEERFALPFARVRAVLDAGTLTDAPGAPPNVLGVVNHGEFWVPVLDLGARLLLSRGASLTGYIVLLETGSELLSVLGIAVDRVEQVGARISKIERLPPRARSSVSCLRRVAHVPEGLLLLLDPERISTRGELGVLARLSEAAP
jgi:chemotaxis signal transduction protein